MGTLDQSRYFASNFVPQRDTFETLTDREFEVLTLLYSGQSNKQAAYILGISHRTVEVHRRRIGQKLGARNAAQLVRITAERCLAAQGSTESKNPPTHLSLT